MQIIFPRHARQRMEQRRVSQAQVEEALADPDDIRVGDMGEEIAVKDFGQWRVNVVYQARDKDMILVIAVIRSRW